MSDSSPSTVSSAIRRAVRIEGVTKRFGSVVAADEISLEIEHAELVALLGPSGCGKTTLLNLIAGFQAPDAGRILIYDRNVTDTPVHLRDTGMVFQNYALFPHMNAFDNVSFGLRMRKLPRAEIRERVMNVLEMVKLTGLESRRVRELSGGQQQRVALARAIVIQPKVLLLDEPLSALDKNLRSSMQVELKELQKKIGITTVFVTHDQSEALSLSDRTVVLREGRIQQISTPVDLYRRPVNSFVASFIGDINCLKGRVHRVAGDRVELDIGMGIRFTAPRTESALEEGAGVEIFVRPEHITVGASERDANIIHGKVMTAIYQGTHTQLFVTADDLDPVQVRVTDDEAIDCYGKDKKVVLGVNLDKALIVRSGESK